MNVVVIPFFLAAHLTADETWAHGPKYTFQVQVNCTAIPEEGVYGSIRLNLESKLICQPLKSGHSLSCHFEDSKANSFVVDSLDPLELATPTGEVNRQPAYEINEDQFEIKFNNRGLDDLVVNENIQPRELDMIRMIVGQLSVGATLDGVGNDVTFDAMENFTQGECYTTFKIDKKFLDRSLYTKRPGYALRPVFGLKEGKLVQIRKIRNLYMCAHKVPYFFGSADSFREESDIVSDASLSDGHMIITSTEFISGTSNVITTSKITEAVVTTLYENVRLRLESIQPAESEPPAVKEAESASIFIGRWLINDSSEEDNIHTDN